MTNTYRCKRLGKHAPEAAALTDAKILFGCESCSEATRIKGKCFGPRVLDGPEVSRSNDNQTAVSVDKHRVKSETPKSKKTAPRAETTTTPEPEIAAVADSGDIPGITPEIDEAIHHALMEISAGFPYSGMASLLTKRYGEGIRAARSKNRGWKAIATIFRKYGLHIGEKSLRKAVEK